MSEVKTFNVIGKIEKPNFRTNFRKRMRALTPDDAVEEVYKILGSKHKVKRYHIVIEKVEEAPDEEDQTEQT